MDNPTASHVPTEALLRALRAEVENLRTTAASGDKSPAAYARISGMLDIAVSAMDTQEAAIRMAVRLLSEDGA